MRNLTCKNCGWMHFAVSRAHAISETAKFNKYYAGLTPAGKRSYGGPCNLLATYGRCDFCGAGNTESRDSTQAEIDAIYGCTIGPLVAPEENLV